MKLKVLANLGTIHARALGVEAGDFREGGVVDVPEQLADQLIRLGVAASHEEPPPRRPKPAAKDKPAAKEKKPDRKSDGGTSASVTGDLKGDPLKS